MTNLKFFWNGVKGSDGKLQCCTYSDGILTNHPAGTLTIYAAGHKGTYRFKGDVAEAFEVHNDTDSQTDYFEADRIRVTPDHPMYAAVKAGLDLQTARWAKKYAKK